MALSSSRMSVVIILTCFTFSLNMCVGTDYDYLSLALQWQPAYCRIPADVRINCQSNLIVKDNFTIHGLWPSKHSGPQPRNCIPIDSQGETLDIKKILPATFTKLKKSWTSLIGDDTEFWKSQWKVHGTCYYTKNQKQAKYLNTAYNFWSGFNLFNRLKVEGIVPVKGGKLYTTEAAIKAFKKSYAEDTVTYIPEFKCSTPTPSSPSELYEIIMCLDHDGNEPINCTTTSPSCGKQFLWKSEK
ncbi:intracellular ribonuclease LX-like [Vicia villosa]|uniref:intracellular ribonuclease LX-like n=1 Tax=Vicia villosa TaxID=3911 RepID=UPI00273A97A5|nr:intracellular ribonuclease LX-like [Vicia villosa]